jgi:hypothetical protein
VRTSSAAESSDALVAEANQVKAFNGLTRTCYLFAGFRTRLIPGDSFMERGQLYLRVLGFNSISRGLRTGHGCACIVRITTTGNLDQVTDSKARLGRNSQGT